MRAIPAQDKATERSALGLMEVPSTKTHCGSSAPALVASMLRRRPQNEEGGSEVGTYEHLVDRLFAFHAETDDERRRAMASDLVTEDVEFYGILSRFSGIEELISGFRGHEKGQVLIRTSEVDEHRGWLRNAWEYRGPDGEAVRLEEGDVFGGLVVIQLSDDGRFCQIVPFRGLNPPGME